METSIQFTRINNDVNGNPRYVCHYLNLLTTAELSTTGRTNEYDIAVSRARRIGGKRFHNKQYGGGIVFQSYNIAKTEQDIKSLLK